MKECKPTLLMIVGMVIAIVFIVGQDIYIRTMDGAFCMNPEPVELTTSMK